MSKKRNRQPDANGDASEGSTESCDDISTDIGAKCPHIAKAINLNKIKKNIKKTGIATECSACKKGMSSSNVDDEEFETVSPALWICLQCGNQGCGRSQGQHAIEHYQKPHSDCHCMVTDTHQWSVWCYNCEIEINANCRKKLLEVVEFMKKSVTSYTPSQPKMPVVQCQKEIAEVDKEKQKFLCNLPKVGGLANLGNTCFFNAVLQCLAQTPFLVKVLDDLRVPGEKFVLPGGKHKVTSNTEEEELPPIEGTLERWRSFTSILCKTLTEMQCSNGHQTYRPAELLSTFKKKTMQCRDGGQHDSHELLRHLLELVRNEDLRRYQSIILREVGLSEKTKPDCVEENLKSRVKFYGNQASARLLGPELVFRGVLVSTLECLDCHHSSQRTEPFLDLSLPVMADKPQPPILKRKNSGYEDTFDMMGNNISNLPLKHQLKKEKKAARKNRKNVRQENYNSNQTLVNQSNNIEENNCNMLESGIINPCSLLEESDADVEDNVEAECPMPEVGESGYSSEKASALASPMSPADRCISDQNINSSNMNGSCIENSPPLIPMDNIESIEFMHTFNINTLNSPSPTDVSMADLTQRRFSSEADKIDSSGSPENENGVQTGFSLSTSLAVNSDLTSPDGPTASLSSSITSKDSPTSPLASNITNGDDTNKTERPVSRLDLIEPTVCKDKEGSQTLLTDLRTRRRKVVSITNVDKFGSYKSECGEAFSMDQESCNGINDITSGFSKLGISSTTHQSPTRYPTKEGECSIQSCLNQFTALELMSGSNKVGCEACTAREKKEKNGKDTKLVYTPSTKQYLISRVPAVLILHLKRFQAQRVGFRKVTKHVSFPLLLDLAPVCKGHKKSRLYSLYGVVEHSGTLHGGHYVAYVKTRLPLTPDDPRWAFLPSKDAKDVEEMSGDSSSDSEGEEASAKVSSVVEPPPGMWYYVSDSQVMEVDESAVLESQAYLLFYERIL